MARDLTPEPKPEREPRRIVRSHTPGLDIAARDGTALATAAGAADYWYDMAQSERVKAWSKKRQLVTFAAGIVAGLLAAVAPQWF